MGVSNDTTGCAMCDASVWTVDEHGMLRHCGADGFSAAFIADCLSGEDEGRITVEDVELLFVLVKAAVHA